MASERPIIDLFKIDHATNIAEPPISFYSFFRSCFDRTVAQRDLLSHLIDQCRNNVACLLLTDLLKQDHFKGLGLRDYLLPFSVNDFGDYLIPFERDIIVVNEEPAYSLPTVLKPILDSNYQHTNIIRFIAMMGEIGSGIMRNGEIDLRRHDTVPIHIFPGKREKYDIEFRFFLEILQRELTLKLYRSPWPQKNVPNNLFIQCHQEPWFLPSNDVQTETLLFTSSFSSDEKQFFTSAQELGEIKKEIPHETELCIKPFFTREDMLRIFDKNAPEFQIWYHAGHADVNKGLWLYNSSDVFSGETLLNFFPRGQKRVALVVFATCHSMEIARFFAEQRVGAALGFKGETLDLACKELTIKITLAALQSGCDHRCIYGTFEAFKSRYGTGDLERRATPYLFFSK
ncbi:hypothetical protein ACFL4G_11635 [Thermodesulfobacteriota bacterium]